MKNLTLVSLLLLGIVFTIHAQPGTEAVRILKKHTAAVKALAFSADGQSLASGGEDKMIYLWNLNTGAIQGSVKNTFGIRALQYTSDNQLLAACGAQIRLVDLQGKLLKTFGGFTTDIWSMDFNEASGRIMAGSYAKSPKVWNFESGQQVYNLAGHEKSCLAVDINATGDLAASGSLDRSVRLWNMKDGSEQKRLDVHSDNIFAVDFDPSGKYLLSASADKTIRLWDVQSGKVIRTYGGHEGSVFDVQFCADGTCFLSCSADKTIILRETFTGKQLHVFEEHTGAVNEIRFSPDGQYFASASDDQTVRIWKVEKKYFVDAYFLNEIEEAKKGSSLFIPKQAGESKQDYTVRQQKASDFEEKLYEEYYQKYLALPKITE